MRDLRDEVWKRNEVDSPCVKLCTIHPTARICIGCMRTIDEIAGWSRLTAEDRHAIMAELLKDDLVRELKGETHD